MKALAIFALVVVLASSSTIENTLTDRDMVAYRKVL